MLEVHEVANLFPLMDAEDFEKLKADIAAHGQRDPIITYKGKIIDGRHRNRACSELGIEPRVQEWDGAGSMIEYVISVNLHRRHLTSSQRAVLALEFLPLLEAEAKERQRAGGGDKRHRQNSDSGPRDHNAGRATEQAARLLNTNRQFVADAKRIAAQAPETLERVKAGEVKLAEAAKQVKPRLSRIEAKKRRDNQRRKCMRGLDGETKKLLGEHKVTTCAGQMKTMSRLQLAGRRLVARLIASGKAIDVEHAKDTIVNEAGRRAETEGQESEEPPALLPIGAPAVATVAA